MTTNFDLHKKGNKHSMQSKPQDLCWNRKTGGNWEEEKRGMRTQKWWGADIPPRRKS